MIYPKNSYGYTVYSLSRDELLELPTIRHTHEVELGEEVILVLDYMHYRNMANWSYDGRIMIVKEIYDDNTIMLEGPYYRFYCNMIAKIPPLEQEEEKIILHSSTIDYGFLV